MTTIIPTVEPQPECQFRHSTSRIACLARTTSVMNGMALPCDDLTYFSLLQFSSQAPLPVLSKSFPCSQDSNSSQASWPYNF